MANSQHVHKYRRVDMGRELPYYVMQCSLPGCTHFIHMKTKTTVPQLVGKMSLCNRCGGRFLLTRASLRLANPICEECVVPKNSSALKKANDFFKKIEEGLPDDVG